MSEEVFKICKDDGCVENLSLNHKRSELLEMYSAVFRGLKPRNSLNRLEIAYKIYQYYQDDIRVKDLTKILR